MKVTKRIVSLLLALVMMLSVLSVVASAATATTVRQYKTYVSIGDSVGAGFSLPDYDKYGTLVVTKKRIEGSWPSIVGDAVQANNFVPLSQPGFRTTELRVLVDNSYEGDRITKELISELAGVPYGGKEIIAQRKEYQDAIKKADLITLECGLNDTWLPLMATAHDIEDANPLTEQYLPDVYEYLNDFGSIGDVIKNGMNTTGLIFAAPQVPLILADQMGTWIPRYIRDYDILVKKIFELNPNATVVATSCYNPFTEWTIPEENGIAILMLLQPMYDILNVVKQQYVSQYPGQYFLADINDVKVRTNSFSSLQQGGFDPHPTAAGHKYIAKQVLGVLPTGKRQANWKRPATKPQSTTPLFSKGSAGWGVYVNGSLDTSYHGIAKSGSGKLYYVKGGVWAKDFNGIASANGKKYYIKAGRVQSDFSGTVKTKTKVYTIKNGVVTSTKDR